MAFPNSPVDPEIVNWGWPWHGRIESATLGAATGVLRLPSGATMTVRRPTDHWTYLWDIGMPPPGIASENPDEQWLNKAIIRSPESGGARTTAAWYGGATSGGNAQRYPMYVPGRGTLLRRFNLTPNDFNQTSFTARLEVLGVGAVERIYTRAQLGLNVTDAEVSSVTITAMDNSPRGGRCLLLLVPNSLQGELFGRSVIELTAIVGDLGLDIGLNVLARYSDKTASYENGFDSLDAERAQTMAVWVSSVPDVPNFTGILADGPPGDPRQWQLGARWPVGGNTSSQSYEGVIWAWYKPDGSAELVKYRQASTTSGSWSGGVTSRSGSYTTTETRSVLAGGRSADLVIVSVVTLSGDNMSADRVGTLTIEGDLIRTGTETAGPIELFVPSYLPIEIAPTEPPKISTFALGFMLLSNKLIAPYLPGIRRNPALPASEDWAGPALHPTGVHAGSQTRQSTWPEPERFCWALGAYNPITGQVVRHLRDLYCTWV